MPGGARWCQVVPGDARWCQVPDGAELGWVGLGGCFTAVPNGSEGPDLEQFLLVGSRFYLWLGIAAITDNADVYSERTTVSRLLGNNFWGQPQGHPSAQHHSYRPVTTLTFRWSNDLHGMYPFGFHLTNVLLHGIVAVLFVSMSRLICAGDPGTNHLPRFLVETFWPRLRSLLTATPITPALEKVPVVAGLLFAMHPIHTEAVSNMVCRAGV